MDPVRVQEVLAKVQAPTIQLREALLSELCGEDLALEQEVRARLASTEEVQWAPEVGERLGPYLLKEKLGQGGMGTVFLAERDADFNLQVAIKFLKPCIKDADMLRRFEAERRILASLNHPHIARLQDGGLDPAGLPWFALEYIQGVDLISHANEEKRNIRDRLGLFLQVCEAVDYAHRNLIIHRDLKPSNILVDLQGTPKLLDFGVASVLQADDEPYTTMTVNGAFMLTPEYASPEQLEGRRLTVTTDIYSLGVILYQLLTNRLPYNVRTTGSVLAREQKTPPAPSTLGITTQDRTFFRADRDLDSIVFQAIRTNPENRYESIAHLRSDIQRYLDGLPILARKLTWGYRIKRFTIRNRWRLITASAFLVLFVGALMITVAERDKARRERDAASMVTQFLEEIFSVSNPHMSHGREVSAAELLANGRKHIDRELAGQPEIRARLLGSLGHAYEGLGLYEEAADLFEQRLTILRSLSGVSWRSQALAISDFAQSTMALEDHKQAESLFREALDLYRSHLGEQHEDVATALNHLAVLMERTSHYSEAEPLAVQALQLRRDLLGEQHPDTAEAMSTLGLIKLRTGSYDLAADYLQRALDMNIKALGSDHPKSISARERMALAHTSMGQFQKAEIMEREALALTREMLGDDHPKVAELMANLAETLRFLEKHDEAAQFFEDAINRFRSLPSATRSLALTMNNFAIFLMEKPERHLDAEQMLREALTLQREHLGERHAHVALTLNNLLIVYYHLNQLDKAEQVARKALSISREILEPNSPRLANQIHNFAYLLMAQKKYTSAETLMKESLDIGDKVWQEGNPTLGVWTKNYAELFLATNRPEQAIHWGKLAQERLNAHFPAEHRLLGKVHLVLGSGYLAKGELQKASEHLTLALKIKKSYDTNPGDEEVAMVKLKEYSN